jgi:5-methylcytosine-specific restriction endonuclease McrA
VAARASYCCEYCKTQERLIGMPLVVDHVIPTSVGGQNELNNLAAACYRCNEFKGARTSGRDPLSHEEATLFHPRTQLWFEHFSWTDEGIHVKGKTATGGATVEVLQLNNSYVTESRKIWITEDWYPPFLSQRRAFSRV